MNSLFDCGLRIADCGFEETLNRFLIRNPQSAIRNRIILICLLVFTAHAARAQEVKAAETIKARVGASVTGTITGRVLGEDGRPLADAAIYVYRPYARVPGPPLTASSDGEGKFRISGVESGLYTVRAMLPGFVNTQDAVTDVDEGRYYRPGDSVNLTLMKGGVITGTVRDANGDPVVALAVRAVRVRDATGRAATRFPGFFPERMTDDRGVFRLYGLSPGTYVVSAGGSQRLNGALNAYEGDAPTFFPSSTRDTAVEVPVRGGEEATGIDIRYRGERGHIVSGTVSGAVESNMNFGITIMLKPTSASGYEAMTFVGQSMKKSFSFFGVADGEYEVLAQQWGGASDGVASIPRRITVKGASVTGVELALVPLASITGRLQLEAVPKENCADNRGATLPETLINARRDEKGQPEDTSRTPFFFTSGGIPTEDGEFTIRNLIAGSYRLNASLPGDSWYIRSILMPVALPRQPSAPAKAAETKSASVTPVVTLKTGERLTGVAVNIAQDASGLRGRVAAATEGAALPANLQVHLVPTERERAEDVLRYSEAPLGSDGAFTLTNLAPGRYWLIARPAPESESLERGQRPLAWDASERAKLRREAEAANTTIELQSCQRVNDYVLRYAAAK